MTPPTLFAIFVLCSPDLLTCEPLNSLEFVDRDLCQSFVTIVEEYYTEHFKGDSLLLGSCVWRIVKEEK